MDRDCLEEPEGFSLSVSFANLKKTNRKAYNKSTRYQLYGWLLFIACALLFIVASIINWEPLMLVGSVIFLLACFLFLIPLIDIIRNGKGKN